MRRRRNQRRAAAERSSSSQHEEASASPKSADGKSFRGVVIATGIFLGTIFTVVLAFKISRMRQSVVQEITTPGGGVVYRTSTAGAADDDATTNDVLPPPEVLVQLDAILLLPDTAGKQSVDASLWCDHVTQIVEKRFDLLSSMRSSKRKRQKKNLGDVTQPFPILPLDSIYEKTRDSGRRLVLTNTMQSDGTR